jgi:hypothetical protein
MLQAAVIQCSGGRKGVLSCAVMHKLAAVMIHNLLVEEGCTILRCHASSLLL